ncbi:MAG: hypothetical protein HY881_26285 [Deltaproteobacteria bacterium]|nr:hypothetical protein [Deltaproteobacteria bacterium]
MSQVEMLEETVKQLSPSERAAFRSWFIEFDATEWDRQIEMDSDTGKLDRLVQNAFTHPSTSRKSANTDQSV